MATTRSTGSLIKSRQLTMTVDCPGIASIAAHLTTFRPGEVSVTLELQLDEVGGASDLERIFQSLKRTIEPAGYYVASCDIRSRKCFPGNYDAVYKLVTFSGPRPKPRLETSSGMKPVGRVRIDKRKQA